MKAWNAPIAFDPPPTQAITASGRKPFFFQAEDGIRALTVTGVQTCALPIYGDGDSDEHAEREPLRPARAGRHRVQRRAQRYGRHVLFAQFAFEAGEVAGADDGQRSEERRGGKECRPRWAPVQYRRDNLDRGW